MADTHTDTKKERAEEEKGAGEEERGAEEKGAAKKSKYEGWFPVEIPTDDCKIWRYVDVLGLISQLVSDTLYIPRADQFIDSWEGIVPESITHNNLFVDQHGDASRTGSLMTAFFLNWSALRFTSYVSCWHLSDIESHGMWGLYGNAVAIQSTVGDVKRILTHSLCKPVTVGKVEYVDYSERKPRTGGIFKQGAEYEYLLLKRKSFAHEREVRFVLGMKEGAISLKRAPNPRFINVSPANCAISKIYCSPSAPPWHRGALESILKRLDLGIPVISSELNHPAQPSISFVESEISMLRALEAYYGGQHLENASFSEYMAEIQRRVDFMSLEDLKKRNS